LLGVMHLAVRGKARGLDRGTHDHLAALGARHRAPDQQQVAFATSTSTTRRFSVVRRSPPMRPDMRLPANTRPGVWRWPIEPGARCVTETPCVWLWTAGEVVALHRAREALADRGARDIHHLARLEDGRR
jgi:hypothetical protein